MDYVVDAAGEATPIRGRPFSGDVAMRFVDVVGPWPSQAWGLAVIEAYLYGSVPARSLQEWDGREWSELVTLSTLLDSGSGHLQAWGRDGAVALPYLFTELIGDSDEPTRDVMCIGGIERLGPPSNRVPALAGDDCGRSIDAFGASPTRDAFVVGRQRTHAGGPVVSTWGPLEVQRWAAGAATPVRDDLDAALGYAPITIDAWDHRTLLVTSSTDAYFAVMTPEDTKASPNQYVVVLHFDGRTWSEALRTPLPWAGLERADDGSVWLVSGDALYVQAPPLEAPGFRRVPGNTAKGADGRMQTVVPQQVMPWGATRASVIGRYGGEVGLFTVTTTGVRPPR